MGRSGTIAHTWLRARVSRSAWAFTGALLVIVLGSVLLVDELHTRAYEQQQAYVVASELEQDAGELGAAERALLTGRHLHRAVEEVDDELADLHVSATQLRALSDDPAALGVEQGLLRVGSAVRDQLAHARAGDLVTAEQVADQRTRPALEAFDDRVDATIDHYQATAVRATEVSGMGLWVALLVAGAAIAGLSWRHERTRRRAQREVEQRLRERVEEVAEITERHRQLEELKYSFVTAVSHELRTPLTAIHGSLEMLEDGDVGRLPPAVERVVSVAARGTRRLSRLVEEIIDLERLESGRFDFHPAPHDVHALMLETVESLAPLAEDAGVRLVLDGGHVEVLCDGDRSLQALVNLVGNAIKFSLPGGSIHLETVVRDVDVEVTVRDEGRGIPADQLGAVFDRFHQVDTRADQAKGGAGLGLTITRHIIQAQGGRIWVESEHGTGTAFRFTLPRTGSDASHPDPLGEARVGSGAR